MRTLRLNLTTLVSSITGRGSLASSDPEARIEEVARFLGAILEEGGLEAALIGGHAVNFWETPRFTEDFDFTVAANPEAIQHILERLKAAGWEIERHQDRGGPSGPDFIRMTNPQTRDMLDIQAAKTDYQNLVIRRAVREEGQPFPVATREDLVILKLIAWRSVDQQDVLRLGRRELNWDYIAHWCEIWGTTEKLAWLRRTLAEEPPTL